MAVAAPKFGPQKINPGTGRLTIYQGKGAKDLLLPHRHAMNVLTKGNPSERSFQNYAKLTPVGANAPTSYQDIIDMATKGASVLPK
jgi:hypothetical protein